MSIILLGGAVGVGSPYLFDLFQNSPTGIFSQNQPDPDDDTVIIYSTKIYATYIKTIFNGDTLWFIDFEFADDDFDGCTFHPFSTQKPNEYLFATDKAIVGNHLIFRQGSYILYFIHGDS
jgi:hypothetical protein